MNENTTDGSFKRYRVRYSPSLTGLVRDKKRLKKCYKLQKTSAEIEEDQKQEKEKKKSFKPFSQLKKKLRPMPKRKNLNGSENGSSSQSSIIKMNEEKERVRKNLDNNIANLTSNVEDLTGILAKTVELGMSRSGNLNNLVEKADDLQRNASALGLEAKCVRKKFSKKNNKYMIITVSAFLSLGSVIIIVLKSIQVI